MGIHGGYVHLDPGQGILAFPSMTSEYGPFLNRTESAVILSRPFLRLLLLERQIN